MARIIRLSESELVRLVKNIINEESNSYKIPKVGDWIRISNSKNNNESFYGEVYNIVNNYIIYLKSRDGSCAQYVWELEPGAEVRKDNGYMTIKDPKYWPNLNKISCK